MMPSGSASSAPGAVPDCIQALKVPFHIVFPDGRSLDRWVYAYAIHSGPVTLIDCATSSYGTILFKALQEREKTPDDICRAVLTHAHPDHMGGALTVRKRSGCVIAAHLLERDWIQDVDLQYRQRPVPGFHLLVEGPVMVDQVLRGGENIDIGGGRMLEVIHTPGHAIGHICLSLREEGVLFSGDAVPVEGEMPIYEDLPSLVRSIRTIRDMNDLRVLLSSWDEPRFAEEIPEVTGRALDSLQRVHTCVLDCADKAVSIPELAQGVVKGLGLPPHAANPLFFRTVKAHLEVRHIPDIREMG